MSVMDNKIEAWSRGWEGNYKCPYCGIYDCDTEHTVEEEGSCFEISCFYCKRFFVVTVSHGDFYSCKKRDFVETVSKARLECTGADDPGAGSPRVGHSLRW